MVPLVAPTPEKSGLRLSQRPSDHAQVVERRLSARMGRKRGRDETQVLCECAASGGARAGVSRSAVSRTFTDGASVSDATRRKVMQSRGPARGITSTTWHASLIQEASGIVCLIGADLNTPYQSRMLDALTRRLQSDRPDRRW